MRPYLKHIKIDSFGFFANKVVTPFSSGLNVVFGQNEAGKTTLASFVAGVLFGWESDRGSTNAYKPSNAVRAGSLFFETDQGEVELYRKRNADGLIGEASLIEDIDKETFSTMFNLTSDELRTLRNTTDVTSRLLTAGSGTGSSPALALTQIQKSLAEYTSRASGIQHSIVNLQKEEKDIVNKIADAKELTEQLKTQNKELFELKNEHARVADLLTQRTEQKEALSHAHKQIKELESAREQLQEERALLKKNIERTNIEFEAKQQKELDQLVSLSATEERTLRSRIEALKEEDIKLQHECAMAQHNLSESEAAYEAAVLAMQQKDSRDDQRQKRVKAGLLILLPLVFLIAGLPLFVHGRTISSLSFTVAGAGLVLFAILLSLAAFTVLLRPNKEENFEQMAIDNAELVVAKDQKKLQSCLEQRDEFSQKVAEEFDKRGLACAGGLLSEADLLLNEAKEEVQIRTNYKLKIQSLTTRLKEIKASLQENEQAISAAFEQAGITDSSLCQLRTLESMFLKSEQLCKELLETSGRLNRRHGELTQILAQGASDMHFNRLKLESEQIRTRLAESKREYAKLLLAKRMLEQAISVWESKSQPEVYKQASRLFSTLTNGRWVRVEMGANGEVEVTDSTKTKQTPKHLSYATCQQLYLALRIALLITADEVGRTLPLLADDILVNFDAKRRKSAAKVLVELANHRQVILFTCHEEVVEVLRSACPELNLLTL